MVVNLRMYFTDDRRGPADRYAELIEGQPEINISFPRPLAVGEHVQIGRDGKNSNYVVLHVAVFVKQRQGPNWTYGQSVLLAPL